MQVLHLDPVSDVQPVGEHAHLQGSRRHCARPSHQFGDLRPWRLRISIAIYHHYNDIGWQLITVSTTDNITTAQITNIFIIN